MYNVFAVCRFSNMLLKGNNRITIIVEALSCPMFIGKIFVYAQSLLALPFRADVLSRLAG